MVLSDKECDIRTMTMDDYAAVRDLWTRSEGIVLRDWDSLQSMDGYLRRNPGSSFVALSDSEIVGAVICGHDGRRGYLQHLAVNQNYRHRGIGQRLVEHAVAQLRIQGIRKCHIFILRDNFKALSFWRKIGWFPRSDIELMSMEIHEEIT